MANTNQIGVEDTDDLNAFRSIRGAIFSAGALLTGAGMPASASIMDQITNHYAHWVEIDDEKYGAVKISPLDTYNYNGMMIRQESYLAPRKAPTVQSVYNTYVGTRLLQSNSESNELATLIQSFSSLHVGWDGGEAEPLSQNTINEGLSFIELFLSFSETKPHVSPAGDGELSFAWKSEKDYLEASFYGDGTLYWYSDIEGNKETDTFEFSRKSIPRSLMDKILNFDEQ